MAGVNDIFMGHLLINNMHSGTINVKHCYMGFIKGPRENSLHNNINLAAAVWGGSGAGLLHLLLFFLGVLYFAGGFSFPCLGFLKFFVCFLFF